MGRRHNRESFASALGTCLIKFPQHLGCIGIADTEFEASQAKLHRIPEWSAPNKGDGGSKKKTHLSKTHRELLVAGQSGDDGLLAGLERGKRKHEGCLAAPLIRGE